MSTSLLDELDICLVILLLTSTFSYELFMNLLRVRRVLQLHDESVVDVPGDPPPQCPPRHSTVEPEVVLRAPATL